LTWFIVGFVCYFLLMVYALPHASVLPYQIFALCGLLNLVIIGAFVFGIRKVYLRMKGLTLPEADNVDEITAKRRRGFDRRRLKWLWMGAGLYSLIFLNAVRLGFAYADRLPLLVIIFAEVLNGTILATFLLSIREIHRSRESENFRRT
jgi:hypothetical protein